MKLSVQRESLLSALQLVIGAVERRQTLQVLNNVLLKASDQRIALTATDMEIELVADAPADVITSGETTIPARKLLDITRSLPSESTVQLHQDGAKVLLKCGKSRFTLTSQPANEFPSLDELTSVQTVSVPQHVLAEIIAKTSFSMAQKDVRYYLNGLLIEVNPSTLRAVATDGHRLALCEHSCDANLDLESGVIVPRKGVLELQRILDNSETPIDIQVSSNHLRIDFPSVRFTTKLIDGRFPDYNRVIPKEGDKQFTADRELLKQSLQRASILCNEKYKGVRLALSENMLTIQAQNPEQEEAQDELPIQYSGPSMEVGFNVVYMINILDTLDTDTICVELRYANSSCLIHDGEDKNAIYVVMPMRL